MPVTRGAVCPRSSRPDLGPQALQMKPEEDVLSASSHCSALQSELPDLREAERKRSSENPEAGKHVHETRSETQIC